MTKKKDAYQPASHVRMTTLEFKKAMNHLNITPRSCREKIGVGRRQFFRLLSGEARPSSTLTKLIEAYLKYGLPKP